ncbi:MAG: hypothetical protein VW802_10020 [Rhodospirillaceae bacterium]
MMKYSTLLITAALFCFWAADSEAGYRETKWGMTFDQVAKIKPGLKRAAPVREDHTTAGNISITHFGHPTHATYMFDKTGLMEVSIVVPFVDPDVKKNEKLARQLYDQAYAQFVKDYGKPVAKRKEDGMNAADWLEGDTKTTILYLGVFGHAVMVTYKPNK